MIIHWNDDIKKETVGWLALAFNTVKPEDKLTWYLNTDGGDNDAMEAIIHILNTHPHKITLVGQGHLYSAGFFIFYRAECKRILLPGTLGMAHSIRVVIETDEKRKPYYWEDTAYKQWIGDQKRWTVPLMKQLEFTKQEIDDYFKGIEVYFQPSRMLKMLKLSERARSKR